MVGLGCTLGYLVAYAPGGPERHALRAAVPLPIPLARSHCDPGTMGEAIGAGARGHLRLLLGSLGSPSAMPPASKSYADGDWPALWGEGERGGRQWARILLGARWLHRPLANRAGGKR